MVGPQVAMLVTEGKEQQMVKEILTTKDGINHKIAKANEVDSVLYKESPRLIPPEFNPKCVETFIDVKDPEPEPPKESKKKKTKANKKSTKTPIKVCKCQRFITNRFVKHFRFAFSNQNYGISSNRSNLMRIWKNISNCHQA